jgi:hypothetical protein
MKITNKKQFIEKSNKVHNNKYDYSLVDFSMNVGEKVKIICPVHGIFEQRISEHFDYGCKRCGYEKSQYNKYKNKKTLLYFIKIDDLYKIGVCQSGILNRYRQDINNGIDIKVLDFHEFDDGVEALAVEQKILEEYKHFKYLGENIINGGNSELFTKDIFDDLFEG